jgi:hypothetical protein
MQERRLKKLNLDSASGALFTLFFGALLNAD